MLAANLASASGCRIPLIKLARSPWQTGGRNRWTAACEMMPLQLVGSRAQSGLERLCVLDIECKAVWILHDIGTGDHASVRPQMKFSGWRFHNFFPFSVRGDVSDVHYLVGHVAG